MKKSRAFAILLILLILGGGLWAKSRSVGKVKAYPNPFHPGRHTLTITPIGSTFFSGNTRFIVYDFNQKKIYSSSTVSNSALQWNGHTDSGARVAPGLYYIKIIQTFPDSAVGTKFVKVLVQ